MERSSTAHEAAKTTTDKSAHFQSHIVAEQLRYGGILSAVKVARSGLPNRFHFLDFYQRYRCVANPLYPGTASLPLFLTEQDDESVVKAHCETLVLSLTNQSDTPVVVSVLQARLEEEMQALFRKRSVRLWMGSIGGVINQGNAAVGVTKVFLGKHAHTVLESCLYHQLALCRNKIADLVLKFAAKKRLARTLRVIRVVQRVMRGALARARTRALRSQKAALANVKVVTPVASAVVSGAREVRSFAAQVQTYKQQDLTIQEQIKKLVNSNKVDEDEPEFITIDFPAVKAELLTYAGKFSNSSVINVKTSEASDALAEGYTLLRPEKLIPLTAVGKALNFGRSAKSDNRTSSVKSANKVITKDHSMFKTMHKLMDRLRELFELAKLEKDVLETRKRNKNTRPNSLVSPMRRASITTGDNSSQKNDPEAAEIDMKMVTLDKVAKLSRTLYQFYHQYIMQVRIALTSNFLFLCDVDLLSSLCCLLQIVKEFGYESKYKSSFADDNQYLLGFTTLVEGQKPLLSFEKSKTQANGAQSGETPATEDTQSASKSFPLYIPGEDQQGPQHKGYAPLCTYGGVHFKVLPANHAPGVEYAFNCLHRLLDGAHLMYPIKYLKMIGKSGEGKGKETYYQAAMEFGSQSLASVGAAGASQIVLDDFSAAFVTSVLFGAKSLYPEHLQVHSADGKVHLKGFNVDDDLLCQLFRYYGGHTHSGVLTPGGVGGPVSPGSPMVHASDLNILYMLPLMDAPISPSVVALLTAATAAPSLTSSWLKDLHMQNRRYGVLKAVGFTPSDLTNLTLPIALPVHAAAQIQHMLVKIGKALSQGVANGLPLTHSDLLAALEAGTAEKYAELRIQTSKVTPFELFETHRARIASPAKPSASQGKATLTMAVDTMTAEVLNTLDFTTLDASAELETAYAELFDNFSYLPSLHLRNISEAQLKLLFSKILEVNKQAFEIQKSFRSTAAPAPAKPEPVRPSVRTTVKTVVVCGLTQQAAKALHTSSVVHAIQQELGIKVSFDITLGKK